MLYQRDDPAAWANVCSVSILSGLPKVGRSVGNSETSGSGKWRKEDGGPAGVGQQRKGKAAHLREGEMRRIERRRKRREDWMHR